MRDSSSFESVTGCLLVVPAFFLSLIMASSVRSTVIVLLQKGLVPAITGQIVLESTKDRLYMLSTGEAANHYLVGSTFFLVSFPVVAGGVWGMAYLAELFGRYAEKGLFRE